MRTKYRLTEAGLLCSASLMLRHVSAPSVTTNMVSSLHVDTIRQETLLPRLCYSSPENSTTGKPSSEMARDRAGRLLRYKNAGGPRQGSECRRMKVIMMPVGDVDVVDRPSLNRVDAGFGIEPPLRTETRSLPPGV